MPESDLSFKGITVTYYDLPVIPSSLAVPVIDFKKKGDSCQEIYNQHDLQPFYSANQS